MPTNPPPLTAFNAYIYATASWYLIRGLARLTSPATVYSWFSAEAASRDATSLEIYNIRTDAVGLVALAALCVGLSGAWVPGKGPGKDGGENARVAIAGTVAHHLGTAVFSYWQWVEPATATGAMLLGWAWSCGLAVLGAAAWVEVGKGGGDGSGAALGKGKVG